MRDAPGPETCPHWRPEHLDYVEWEAVCIGEATKYDLTWLDDVSEGNRKGMYASRRCPGCAVAEVARMPA